MPTLRPASPSPYPPELLAAIQRGKMIEAIKIYRTTTGASLREAKAAVEAIARHGMP
jgi:ribosomal protein L7/L12